MNPHETTEMMPPLPSLILVSRGQRGFARSFGNLAMRITETKRIYSLIVGMGNKNSSTLCNKGCLSVNFPVCSVCQKLGVYSQQAPITAPQYDISSKGEGQPDEILEEAAPNSNSNDEEWWPDEVELNAVTIDNISIDSEPVETDGR